MVIKLPNLERLLAVRQALLFHPFYFSLITYQNFKNFRFPKFVNFIPRLARFLFPKMRMLCDRLSALTAGAMVGVWYAQNFPAKILRMEATKIRPRTRPKARIREKRRRRIRGRGRMVARTRARRKARNRDKKIAKKGWKNHTI